MLLYRHYDLQPFNTLALPARANRLVEFDDPEQLPALQKLWRKQPNRRCWVLGGGSNVVMADHVDALIIQVKNKGVHLMSQQAVVRLRESGPNTGYGGCGTSAKHRCLWGRARPFCL